MTETITVAVCTRDRSDLLQRCLSSVGHQIDEHSELLVIESAGASSEVRRIAVDAGARYAATVRPGLDVARNLALRLARGTVVVFIDDDALAAPNWLAVLRDSFVDPSIACVTGRVLPLELRTPAQRHFEKRFSFDRGSEPIRFKATDERPRFPVYPYHLGTGCNMGFRKQVFGTIGPFDEALDAGTPTGGGGDLDIFRRLLAAGFVALYQPDALVHHQHRESMGETYRQFWAYGKSYTGLLTKSLMVERDMAREAWLLIKGRPREQGRRIARRLLRGDRFPLGLILVESVGNLVGPLAYWYSLWWAQRNCPRRGRSAVVAGSQVNSARSSALEAEDIHELRTAAHDPPGHWQATTELEPVMPVAEGD